MEDYSQKLRSLMQQAQLSSFNELGRQAEVSKWQITQLRRGQADQMRLAPLLKISAVLQMPLMELVQAFSQNSLLESASGGSTSPELDTLRQEYQRLQAQLQRQREESWADFQQHALQVLESWLLYWPTAVYKAQTNPQMAAAQLVPLVRPVENLLREWNVEAIATVNEEVAYDPTIHQLLEGTAQPGERVRVRNVGYRQGDRLLHRAKVSGG